MKIIESRNKREGLYAGRLPRAVINDCLSLRNRDIRTRDLVNALRFRRKWIDFTMECWL